MPLTIQSAAREVLSVPLRFQDMALPVPQGSWTTATEPSAAVASGLRPRPLKTSWGRPSPLQEATTS